MEIEDIKTQEDADQYWLEHGPPTEVERHMAIRTTEKAIIRGSLSGAPTDGSVVLLRKLMGEGMIDG
jgi:hypothetical protein